jgi:hypothetical protein
MHEHLLHAEVHGVMKSPKRLSTANSAINAALTPIVTAPITWPRGLTVRTAARIENIGPLVSLQSSIDADFHEMRAGRRLVEALVEVAAFDQVFRIRRKSESALIASALSDKWRTSGSR